MGSRLKKEISPDQIIPHLKLYINNYIEIKEKLDSRAPNFPDYLSESICKYLINRYTGQDNCSFSKDKGDLCLIKDNCRRRLEIKCFISNGPSSFGPSENWDELYFLDATGFKSYTFKLYQITLSNKDSIFLNLKMSKKETFKDQINNKRRPRISFSNLAKQLDKKYINCIFEGNINNLFICKEQKEEENKEDKINKWITDSNIILPLLSLEDRQRLTDIISNLRQTIS